eukprot:8174088-Alexandrium_andersonii.AAC.1
MLESRAKFRACGNMEEIKAVNAQLAPDRKQAQTLINACNASVADLMSAQAAAAAAEVARAKQAQDKAKKAE